MSRTRQSTPSDHSSSDWESASEAGDLSPSPSATQQPSERIPRPPNCFILYRAHAWKARKEQFERDNVDDTMTMGAYGRHIGPIWRNEPPEVKEYWEKLAADAKREHEAKYPDYQYRPNRGGTNRRTQSAREERTTPAKRAPCRPESKTVEGKEATLSQAERTMKTRSMTRQRQVVVVRTGAQARKASAGGRRRTTTATAMAEPRGDRRPTRRTTRGAVIDLTANFDDEDVEGPLQNQSAPVRRSPVTQQAIQPLPTVGREASPPIADLLPMVGDILSPSFALPVGGVIAPAEQVLPAHSQFPDVFDESFVPSEPQAEWMHPEHDRPSLWDSPDVPLFPPEIFEGESGSASHNAVGGVPNNGRLCVQPTFSATFGAGPSQPMVQVDSLFVGWPTSGCGGQYLGQHLGSFPEPQAWTTYA